MNNSKQTSIECPLPLVLHAREVPPSGQHMRISGTEQEYIALALHLGVLKVYGMLAALHVRPTSSGDVWINGDVTARVSYECGVTLTPYDSVIEAPISCQYVDSARHKEIVAKFEKEMEENPDAIERDMPDEMVDGLIPLGATIAEFLVLHTDPFPRAPNAQFEVPHRVDDIPQKKISPFAILKGKV